MPSWSQRATRPAATSASVIGKGLLLTAATAAVPEAVPGSWQSALYRLSDIEYDLDVIGVRCGDQTDTGTQFAYRRVDHDVCKQCQALALRLRHREEQVGGNQCLVDSLPLVLEIVAVTRLLHSSPSNSISPDSIALRRGAQCLATEGTISIDWARSSSSCSRRILGALLRAGRR